MSLFVGPRYPGFGLFVSILPTVLTFVSSICFASYFSVCPAGRYINVANNNNCDECTIGFYSDTPNSSGCSACPPGLTTETNGTSSSDGCCTCLSHLPNSGGSRTSQTGTHTKKKIEQIFNYFLLKTGTNLPMWKGDPELHWIRYQLIYCNGMPFLCNKYIIINTQYFAVCGN